MDKESATEKRIFDAAKLIFQQKGYDGARMQEIADEARINKSMLHYYYRDKETLFHKILAVSVEEMMEQLITILRDTATLENKVVRIVDYYFNLFRENPDLFVFVAYELNRNPDGIRGLFQKEDFQFPEEFIDQIAGGIVKGEYRRMAPDHFLTNILSLCMMPMLGKNLIQSIFRFDEDEFSQFLEERRRLLPDIILSGIIS